MVALPKSQLFRFISIFFLASCSGNVSDNKSKSNGAVSQEIVTDSNSEIGILNDSITSDSLNAELYIRRANINLANEQVGAAIKDINTALSIDRKNVEALLVLADIYYALGDEDNIMLTLNKACEYAPLDPRPIVKLSELSFLQGNSKLLSC